ncbi:hypothetical protein T08_5646 [Trichinella sp. T8]|nr:hypothetical protein T08_5646 [Trichinella sp. T8]
MVKRRSMKEKKNLVQISRFSCAAETVIAMWSAFGKVVLGQTIDVGNEALLIRVEHKFRPFKNPYSRAAAIAWLVPLSQCRITPYSTNFTPFHQLRKAKLSFKNKYGPKIALHITMQIHCSEIK